MPEGTVFPLAAGQPDLSGDLIRTHWASRFNIEFYQNTSIMFTANTDYEGTIKKEGDTVKINILPTATTHKYVKGQDIEYDDPKSSTVDLLIQRGRYFALNLEDVDRAQAFMDYQPIWIAHYARQSAIDTDVEYYADVYTEAHAANQGVTAGNDTSSYNLGVAEAPIAFTSSTAIGLLTSINGVLDEQSVTEEGRFVTLPARAIKALKDSDLKAANFTGDGTGVVRNGKVGVIDGLNIIQTRSLTTTGTVPGVNCIFGTKDAITFASQFQVVETIRGERTFQDKARQLVIYDWKVIKPESLGLLHIDFS